MSENEHDFLKNRFSSFGNESNSTICWKVCFLNSLTHHRVMFFMQIISKISNTRPSNKWPCLTQLKETFSLHLVPKAVFKKCFAFLL